MTHKVDSSCHCPNAPSLGESRSQAVQQSLLVKELFPEVLQVTDEYSTDNHAEVVLSVELVQEVFYLPKHMVRKDNHYDKCSI